MRSKTILIGVIGVVIGLLLAAAGIALAGSLNPGAGPGASGSQMYTLQQIYDRLATGAATPKMTGFTEPSSGPDTGTMYTLDEIMAKAPVTHTNAATQTQILSGTVAWGLSAGAWGVITGTLSTYNAAVPKTGVTVTYATRDDGDLKKGVAWPDPRFTDNSDGTVTDNLTGLIWLKNANCFGGQTWATAIISATALANGACGLTDGSAAGDWRLPNVREMRSLVHYDFYNPAVPNTAGTGQWTEGNPFTGVQSHDYWTSTTSAHSTLYAWNVYLYDGSSVPHYAKTYTFYVWPVRGGQ